MSTTLRAAYARERWREGVLRRACADVLDALDEDEVDVVVLKGVALAETVYGESPRHSHDLDLLVSVEQAARARRLLGSRPGEPIHHPSTMPVCLHTSLLGLPVPQPSLLELQDRSRSATVAGVPARVLGDTDALFHVCAHAATRPGHASIQWAADAWFLLDRGRDFDWEALVELIVGARLGPQVSLQLHWLAVSLDAPVPDDVLAELEDLARRADPVSRDLALASARAGGQLHMLFAVLPDWRDRARLLGWLLAPSAGYLELAGHGRADATPPRRHLRRWRSYAAARLAALRRRLTAAGRRRVSGRPMEPPAKQDLID